MLSLRFSLCGRALPSRRNLLILFGALLATGCGGPTTPQTLGPILVCPANLTIVSLDGNASKVVYDAPSTIGGEPPLRPVCTPASGEVFVLGNSTVTCNVTDAALRTNSCAFTVTVTLPPRLAATHFLAFGNSITEGKNGDDPSGAFVAHTYPDDLRALLADRYTAQSIIVSARGLGGEQVAQGVSRLQHELDALHPDAVLLEEGINDLLDGDPANVPAMADALARMVRGAKQRGVAVFVATLLPMRAGGPHGSGAIPLIPEANSQIQMIAASEHATLVDLYNGFGGGPDPFIGADGLHPRETGYHRMAELFFDAIRSNLEVRSAPGTMMELVRNMPRGYPPFVRSQ